MKRNLISLSLSNDVASVHKINTLDFLEIISDYRIDPFNLFDLYLPTNSYMIDCTNTQIFVEEGENCASTISVEHLEPLFHTLGSDMALFGLNFKFQEPQVMLVVFLINFGVKSTTSSLSQICYWGFDVNFLS